MSDKKSISEALDHLKVYRNAASDANGVQIEFFDKFIKSATDAFNKPEDQRTFTDNALIESFRFFSDDITTSLESLDKYNKSLEEYLAGFKILKKVLGGESNDR